VQKHSHFNSGYLMRSEGYGASTLLNACPCT
jgi:hypothetical protein